MSKYNLNLVLLRCDIFQGRSASVGVSMKKLVIGSVSVFIRVPLYISSAVAITCLLNVQCL